MLSFLPVYIYFIALSFLVSLTLLARPATGFTYLKAFPFFLILTLTAETVGNYLSSISKNNIMLYNLFSTFEFAFFMGVLAGIIDNKMMKKVIWITMFMYIIAAVCNIFFLQGPTTFHTYTYCIGCLIIVIFCFYYFFELF
ncbi:MAG: hypothetical protein EOO88_61940, partial [Pedobacter sp.]